MHRPTIGRDEAAESRNDVRLLDSARVPTPPSMGKRPRHRQGDGSRSAKHHSTFPDNFLQWPNSNSPLSFSRCGIERVEFEGGGCDHFSALVFSTNGNGC